jgi:ABC-2 type transport system permease protein
MSPLGSQVRTELTLVAHHGEQLLLTLGIPALLLVFLGVTEVLPTGDVDDPLDFLVPGVLALAVMSTAMVSLGIGTGFERSYLVLKRLGATPLGRSRLIVAKVVSVLVVEVVQFAVLLGVGAVLGWRPTEGARWLLAIVAVVLGTTAFAGIGLTMAGRLRGEINLAAANGLYLVLLLLGGMVFPLDELPGPLRSVAEVLPSSALSAVLRDTLGDTIGGTAVTGPNPWIVLTVWAIATPVAASRWFRFE